MSSAADDPHSDRVNADLPAEAPPTAPSAEVPASASDDSVDKAAGPGVPPVGGNESAFGGETHRRRRRRRRRPPREFGEAAAGSASANAALVAPTQDKARSEDRARVVAPNTDAAAGNAESSDTLISHLAGADQSRDAPVTGTATTGLATPDGAPGDRPHRRRRRRRRPPPNAQAPAPGGLGSALSAADAAAGNAEGERPAERTVEGTGGGDGSGDRPRLHLRRPVRGRRQLPRPPGLQPGMAESPLADAGDAVADEAAPGIPGGALRTPGEFPRRRRRRPPPHAAQAPAAGGVQSADSAPGKTNRTPRGRGRDRRPSDNRSHDASAPRDRVEETQRRGPDRTPHDGDARGPARRERGDRAARGRSPGGPRDGQRGRGRDSAPRYVEQKLYALESMVDRGFEDVADEAEENGSRRVHWTIVKRTVADQKSGKPMSMTYVLQREGGETEFPNLGAARAAANKTIVHPEKLTMSKAEHAAAKNSK